MLLRRTWPPLLVRFLTTLPLESVLAVRCICTPVFYDHTTNIDEGDAYVKNYEAGFPPENTHRCPGHVTRQKECYVPGIEPVATGQQGAHDEHARSQPFKYDVKLHVWFLRLLLDQESNYRSWQYRLSRVQRVPNQVFLE